jgi:hypothetical protein
MLKQNGIKELYKWKHEKDGMLCREDGIMWLNLGLDLKILCLMTKIEEEKGKLK